MKEAVRRNIERFPDEFMFELTSGEFKNLRSQITTSSWGGTRYPPFAFTEHGVAMLAGVLNSPKAIQTNIAIIKAFIALRRYALTYSATERCHDNLRDCGRYELGSLLFVLSPNAYLSGSNKAERDSLLLDCQKTWPLELFQYDG